MSTPHVLQRAAEIQAETGMDGYAIASLMACEPSCWQEVDCTRCHRPKQPWGRSVGDEAANSYCSWDCAGYHEEPEAPHLWGPNDETRGITDLAWFLANQPCGLCRAPHRQVEKFWACPDHGHELEYERSEDRQEHHICPEPGCTYGRWIS